MLYACIIVKNGQTDVLGHFVLLAFQILKKIGSQPPVFIELELSMNSRSELKSVNFSSSPPVYCLSS